jgi:glutamyl-tRNA reductase
MRLVGCEIETQAPEDRLVAIDQLQQTDRPLLILNTCQRLEVFGCHPPEIDELAMSQQWRDAVAFERLARIAAGLESRILGELEILGQVRRAYKQFRASYRIDNCTLDRLFQDALALARRARRESGIDRNLTSLSALASRALLARVPAGTPIAVIGSGSIASSVARYLSKRGKSPVRVTSRCPERAMTLAQEVGGFGGGLDDLHHLLDGVGGIVTATAAPHPVLYATHIEGTLQPLHIVDMGVPPDCDAELINHPDIDYMGLDAVEAKAQANTEERRARADVAARIIRDGALAWCKASS